MQINIHLGDGHLGDERKRALDILAAEAGHEWDGKPSIGRWICELADEKLKEDAMNITVIDAIPAMADVVSGAVSRPEPWEPSPEGTNWREKRHWWHWAVKTLAGRRALAEIGCPVDPETPWIRTDDWRVQPWVDPDEAGLHYEEVGVVREALGVPGAGIFYVERCHLDIETANHSYSDQTMVAINEDGTRAAIYRLTHWTG